MSRIFWYVFLTVLSSFLQRTNGRRHPHNHHLTKDDKPELYLNEFAVRIDGNDVDAQAIASKYGLINLGKVKKLI